MAKTIELNISKVIEELEGIDDVLEAPRSWSPKDLRKACMNIEIEDNEDLAPLEQAAIQFLVRDFFFIEHQTGLYNVQRNLWSSIAKGKKIILRDRKKSFWRGKDKYQLSDIILLDESTGKFIQMRVVHPGAKVEYPGFQRLTRMIPEKCTGIFYLTDQDFSEKFINSVSKKTNNKDSIDKYRSPISKNCSLNLIQYRIAENGSGNNSYEFSLIHPNLERKVASTICLNHS